MILHDDLRDWAINLISTESFQQIAPLVVLILVPTLSFFAASTIKRRSGPFLAAFLAFASTVIMSFSLPSWLSWSSSGVSSSGHGHGRESKKIKKHIRTRKEQIEMNGSAKPRGSTDDDGYYPGLVNISGTYCFMNSTLQALASLSYLQPHIEAIHAKAEALDVPTPVVDALRELLHDLNTPRSSYHSIRPLEIIEVLSSQTQGRTNSLFYSREHQDAQELFQVVSECLKNEIAAVDKEGTRDRGFGGLAELGEAMKEIGKSVFDGLTANRRSCVVCGYTEAVMHFSFDSWQLSVPRLAASCRLEDCLEDYTRLEILKDCICRKCSLVATQARLRKELATLEEAVTKPDAKPSASKKKRLKDVRKMEAKVTTALKEGRIEDDLKDVRIEKVFSPASTKQAMIARPPPVLALHLNRSIHYGAYASKNTCRVVFPEVLDLTPYTTSGNLSTVPTASISTPPPAPPPGYPRRSTTPTPSLYEQQSMRTIYRLAAVVCHFGSHSFGHYICYRRKPRGGDAWRPPKLMDPLRDRGEEEESESVGPEWVWEDGENKPGTGWLRISDDSVRECGIESVQAEGSGAFMLYYELATWDRTGVYGLGAAAGMEGSVVGGANGRLGGAASEETLKPEVKAIYLNGSVGSLVSEVGVGVQASRTSLSSSLSVPGKTEKSEVGSGLSTSLPSSSAMFGPRVVRSVAAGRSRSTSVQPSNASTSGSVVGSSDGRASSVLSNPDSSRAASLAPSTLSERSSSSSGQASLQVPNGDAASPEPASPPTSPQKKKQKKKHKSNATTPSSQPPLSPNPAASPTLPPKMPLSPDPTILHAPSPIRPTSPGSGVKDGMDDDP